MLDPGDHFKVELKFTGYLLVLETLWCSKVYDN